MQSLRLVSIVALVLPFVSGAGAQQNSLVAPIAVYSHNATLGTSSVTPVDEKQAMLDLDELSRLKGAGVHTEFDMMEASWFAPASGYRALRADAWPNGPDAWLARCRAAGVRPGLQIDGNAITPQSTSAQIPPAWKDSLGTNGSSLSLFEGGYLPDLMAAMQSWYDRGVRLFAFDSIDLSAATPAAGKLNPTEIVLRNAKAMSQALQAFHDKNRDAVLVVSLLPGTQPRFSSPSAANASAGESIQPAHTNLAQLGAFTVVSAEALKPSADPQANLWRAIDIEGDESVRRLEQSGLTLAQIASSGFTATGSADSGMHAWKGAFLLSMARGGWTDSLHGDLSLIQKDDARWMAHVQRLFLTLQEQGHMRSFGAPAGSGAPYGFAATNARGSVYVVVNPSETAATLALPAFSSGAQDHSAGRLQFSDAGFTPVLKNNSITLGPGQMAMVGYGAFATSSYNLGVQRDVVIPREVELVNADFHTTDTGALEASFEPPMDGVVRVILRPRFSDGEALPMLSLGSIAPHAFTLEVSQYDRPIPVRLDKGNKIERGLGWTVGEIDVNDLTPGVPLVVRFHSNDYDMASLEASAYDVEY
jgi:hypothetical protein